jgi:hypothetical protein
LFFNRENGWCVEFRNDPRALKFVSRNRGTCCLTKAAEKLQHRNFCIEIFILRARAAQTAGNLTVAHSLACAAGTPFVRAALWRAS